MNDIAEILRDPVWQGAAALLTLVGIAITVALARAPKAPRLAYGYRITSLLTVRNDLAEPIRVLFRDREVTDMALHTLKLLNVGKQPIRTSDFDTPIDITFPGAARILSAEVGKTQPQNLQVELKTTTDAEGFVKSVHLQPLLLNPLDTLQLNFLISGEPEHPVFQLRVAGVREIEWFDGDFEAPIPKVARVLIWVFIMQVAMALGMIVTVVPTVLGMLVLFLIAFGGGFWLSDRIYRYFDPYRSVREW